MDIEEKTRYHMYRNMTWLLSLNALCSGVITTIAFAAFGRFGLALAFGMLSVVCYILLRVVVMLEKLYQVLFTIEENSVILQQERPLDPSSPAAERRRAKLDALELEKRRRPPVDSSR